MNYLGVDDVLEIHENQIDEYGGDQSYNVGALGKISSILGQLYPVFGVEKYPTIFNKAAALYYFLIKGHCFVDGNKRVGYMTMFVFLYINNIELCATEEDGYDKTIEVATSNFRNVDIDNYILNDISKWIETNSKYI